VNPDTQDKDRLRLKKFCARCGKLESTKGGGSLTSWIFADNRCHCKESLEPTSAPITTATVQSDQWVALGDRYEVEAILGAGGVGTVYKVHDQKLNLKLAAKVLHPHLAQDAKAAKRFDLEVKTASQLTHPNLVAIYEQSQTPDGYPLYLMDFLDGKNMETVLIEETYLPPERALNLFAQICEAMNYAHLRGIIHRDIKPSNIMLLPTESGGELVKMLDFGIAKVLAPLDEMPANLTQTGELFGSPVYMSPEQCTGARVDQRSDIYSLGCVMYEVLSGQKPFIGENPVQTILKHLREEAAPLPKHLDIPDGLSTIVMNALAKDPAERYQNMQELIDDLQRLPEGKIKRRTKRAISKRQLSLTLFMTVCLLGTTAILLSQNNQPEWVKLDNQASGLFSAGKVEESGDIEIKAVEALEKTPQPLVVRLPIYDHAAMLMVSRHDDERALQYYEKAAAAAQSIHSTRQAAGYLEWIASISQSRGDYQRALEASLQLEQIYRSLFGEHDLRYSDATYRVGCAYAGLNQNQDAITYLEQSLKSSSGNDHGTWLALSWLSTLSAKEGDFDQAQKYYDQLLPLTTKLYPSGTKFYEDTQKKYKWFLDQRDKAIVKH